MAFTTPSFSFKKTMTSADINKNYYHIGSGNRLPQAGATLDPTTGVFNLGSTDYRWNKLHVNNIEYTGSVSTCWNPLTQVVLTDATNTLAITSGLNPSTDLEYRFFLYQVIPTVTTGYTRWKVRMFFNGDSTSNYSYNGTINADGGRAGTCGGIELLDVQQGATTTAYEHPVNLIESHISFIASTTMVSSRSLEFSEKNYAATTSALFIKRQSVIHSIWNNEGSSITSFTIKANELTAPAEGISSVALFATGTILDIWVRR